MINFAELGEEEQNRVVSDGLALMQTITEIWGAEEGIALWEKISEVLGDDARSAIFFNMLTGGGSGNIRIQSYPVNAKIPVIKIIRTYTGAGLSEAKNISEMGMPTFKVNLKQARDCRRDLRELGAVLA